ncbi:hypothetical protein P3T16_006321 [Paraburkholderia sp. GAS42]
MLVELIEYKDVPADGQMSSSAHVPVDGLWQVSVPQGGNGIDDCVPDPAHYVVCLFPRTASGIVSGYCFGFESRRELIESMGDYACASGVHVRLQ